MSTAGEVCNRDVVTVGRNEPIVEAARRMRDAHVGSVVVTEDHQGGRSPVGILTDRDIVVGVVAKAYEHLPSLAAGDVMSSAIVTASDDEDLDAVLARMRSFGVRRVPVVDGSGILLGVLSFDDLVAHLAAQTGELARLLDHERREERLRRR